MGPNILEQQQAGVRALTAGERAVFRELCEASGRSEEEVAQQPGCVTVLEMFLHNYPKICCLGLFPALRVLKVAQQTLSKIENLDGCAHLEQLWLTENEICHISGLDRLTKLRQLYLYSNHISRIENLEALTQLEVLWLADNQIRRVEGLARLTNLRELNLARNYIQTVDRHLQPNFRLHTLNLAANDISSFKQVWHLAELLSLRDLSLSDAHWGESPVARLANYRTYVAVNMPHLACLDALDLSATDKAVAQATILKKTMYYNMRIKALQRNTAALQREAQAHKEQLLQPVWDLLKAAHSERSAVRREVEEKQGAEADRCRPHLTQQLHDKLAALETFVAAKEMQVSDVLACWQAGVASSAAECRERVRRMLVELETGGNIRFEEGKPGDSWYQSCLELLAARFVAADMPPALRNTTLRVTGVTRIHNRALRQRFEERVEDAGEGEEGEEQCHLEYLLAAPPPHSAGDLAGLEEVAQEGFTGPVSLANSLALVAAGRLPGTPPHQPSTPTHLLLAKVLLGNTVQESSRAFAMRTSSGETATAGGLDAVYMCPTSDPRHRLWHVLDHTLILPEYLVRVEHVHTEGDRNEAVALQLPTLVASNSQHLAAVAQPLMDFLAKQRQVDMSRWQAELRELAAAPPALLPRAQLYSMSEEAISRLYGMQALHTLTYINLQGNTIRRIEGLEALRSCQVLVLSCNDIQKMEGLSSLTALQRLDLAYNTIKRIEGLKGLDMLSQLDLSGNSISRAEDINVLKKYVPGLARLDLRRTPLAAQRTYPALLLRRLQHLTCLDGRQLSQADWAQAYDSFQSLTPELIRTHATTRRRNVWTGAGPGMLDAWEDPQWWGRVMEVEVGGRCLRRLQNLEHLTDVQRLAFPANELTAIQGMEACTSLTELNLQDNRISCLDGLTCVTQLRVLELGRNLIHHIHGLAILTCLVQLSLEDNQLTSLEGLSRLSSLMELYVSNNQLSKLRQLHALRGLPHLIILDLAGNPLAALPDYRLYTVYHLRKLKVLDSHSIDASEQAVSRTKYAGRLMADFLTDRLGHCFFDRLRELDLAGLAIRDVGDVFAREDWSQLQHLNLDNNDLAEVHGLTALSSLTCLRLCGNRLGEDCSFGGANGDHPLLYNPAGAPLLFPHLSALHLAEAGISNIVALDLSPLTGLRMLDLSGNKLHRVEGLDSLVSLQELLLARNHIKHVDPLALAGLRRLHKLDLSSNGLRSLANLASLTRLHTLHLAGNRISDLAELDRLSALASLQELSLADNLVARKQWYRAILLSKCPTASMVDGHGVSEEERSFVERVLLAPRPGTEQLPQMSMPSLPVPGMLGKKPIRMAAFSFDDALQTVEDHMSFTDEDIREMRAEPLTRSFLRLTKSSERSPDRWAAATLATHAVGRRMALGQK